MNEAHLTPFYMRDPISLVEVAHKFTPRIAGVHHCHCLIADCDGVPFGYAQWYLNRDYPGAGIVLADRPHGVSIDYFIGNPAYLGRRFGAQMLDAQVRHAAPALAPADRLFHIGHDNRNLSAIRCAINAGFFAAAAFCDKGSEGTLFVRDQRER